MANYVNKKWLLPADDKRTFGFMKPRTVVVHNTANRASAYNEAKYVHSGKSEVSYHFAIDDKECIQLLPTNKSGFHAGDGGKKDGGRYGIGVEICYSLDKGDKRYPVAEDNASHKCAELLLQHGLTINNLSKHQDWSGKYCPHRMLDNNGWEPFKRKVAKYMAELKGDKEDVKTPIIGKPTTAIKQMQAWARSKNAHQDFIDLAKMFYDISTKTGIDPAVVYTQSAKETAYMKFGGVLDISFKNPCGLKTTQGGGNYDPDAHKRFKSWQEGVQAQVDHLALYAGMAGYPKKDSPDPRHFPAIVGTAKNVEDLGGRWAPSKTYGEDIVKMMQNLYTFEGGVEKEFSLDQGGYEDMKAIIVFRADSSIMARELSKVTGIPMIEDTGRFQFKGIETVIAVGEDKEWSSMTNYRTHEVNDKNTWGRDRRKDHVSNFLSDMNRYKRK